MKTNEMKKEYVTPDCEIEKVNGLDFLVFSEETGDAFTSDPFTDGFGFKF